MLIAQGIYKNINGREILKDVGIQIQAGEIVALLGPSGCGKTTLLRNIVLVDQPDRGCLEINDIQFIFPSKDRDARFSIYPLITIVFQQFQLFPHLNVRENLTLPIKRNLTEQKMKFLNELTEFLGLSELWNRYPHQISVGQKQRVAFARAALLEPKYLLLDEVTSSLDVEHISKLMQVIKQLANNGTGILLTTHLIGFAKSIADRVYFMDKGEIIESGDTTILESPGTPRLKSFVSLLNIMHENNAPNGPSML